MPPAAKRKAPILRLTRDERRALTALKKTKKNTKGLLSEGELLILNDLKKRDKLIKKKNAKMKARREKKVSERQARLDAQLPRLFKYRPRLETFPELQGIRPEAWDFASNLSGLTGAQIRRKLLSLAKKKANYDIKTRAPQIIGKTKADRVDELYNLMYMMFPLAPRENGYFDKDPLWIWDYNKIHTRSRKDQERNNARRLAANAEYKAYLKQVMRQAAYNWLLKNPNKRIAHGAK